MKKLSKITVLALCAALAVVMLTGCFNRSFSESGPISVVSRESGSGSRDTIMEMLFGADAAEVLLPSGVIIQNSTAAIYVEVSTNPQAIGYESLGHLADRDGVRVVSVDGVAASVENVRSGAYPFSRNLSVVYHYQTLNENAAANAFRAFLVSSQAQEIIDERGYVSQVENATAYTVIAGLSGTITISGSTTVHPLMNRLAEAFTSLQPLVNVEVAGGGSGAGRNHVRDRLSHFGMVSSPVTDAQRANMTTGGREARDLTIADDAIAIIVHSTNPIENITTDQLRHLFNRNSGTTFSSWTALKAYGA